MSISIYPFFGYLPIPAWAVLAESVVFAKSRALLSPVFGAVNVVGDDLDRSFTWVLSVY